MGRDREKVIIFQYNQLLKVKWAKSKQPAEAIGFHFLIVLHLPMPASLLSPGAFSFVSPALHQE